MTARIIDGRAVAEKVRREAADEAERFRASTGRQPGLATVLVGEDPASQVYVANKRRLAKAAGIADFHRHLPAASDASQIASHILDLVADDAVSGILLQLPLPNDLDAAPLIELIPPDKDVDGLTRLSQGRLAKGLPGLRPCTPAGVMRLLAEEQVELESAEAVVVGRSELVGRPLAQLLTLANATVTLAHSRTRELDAVTRRADVLVVAAGVPDLIGADHVKAGAVVIDVGIHRTESGLSGDVRSDEVQHVAGALTPVPGGVGPMTIATLLANTVAACVGLHRSGGSPNSSNKGSL